LHVATRPRLPSNRTAFVLAAALAAMVPLGLATWTFGRAYHDSEVGRADARLIAGSQVAAAEVNAAAAAAARRAASDAKSRTVQTALERGTPVSLTHDVVSVHGEPGVHTTSPTHGITRVVQVRRGTTVIGTIIASVDLARVAARVTTATSLQIRVLAHAPATPGDLRIGNERFRALGVPAGAERELALIEPYSTIDRSVEHRQLLTLAAGASTLAALAAVILLLPRRLRARREPRRSAVTLVGDVAVAAHDPHALLPVLLETAVVATDAVGGRVIWHGEELASIGYRSANELGLPLDDERGDARLVLYAAQAFSPRDLEILEALVAQGRIALENARLHGIVRRQAQTDELTDLANRRRFMEALHYEVARCNRFGTVVSLVLFDLDRFKRINDRCGHQVGDAVLRGTAHVIHERVRETDLAARIGGEEFAVILAGTDLEGALAFAEDLRNDIAEHVRVERVEWPVTASFGVAASHEECVVDDLIAAADRALYRAKAGGRNTVRAAT
jgi:diguanylate cyclase (GGDEF)-like protein